MSWQRIGRQTVKRGQEDYIHWHKVHGVGYFCAYVGARFLGAYLERGQAEAAIDSFYQSGKNDRNKNKK